MSEPSSTEPRVHDLESLEQVKVLADPLRVRLLEAFHGELKTTKQVAGLLGEKPGRLYHHVDALEKAGLLKLVKTRPNRGTLEKYYAPVAEIFRADPALFTTASPAAVEDLGGMVSANLQAVAAEFRDNLARADPDDPCHEALAMRLYIQAPPGKVEAFKKRLQALVEEIRSEEADGESSEEPVTFGAAFVLYPVLDRRIPAKKSTGRGTKPAPRGSRPRR